MSSAFDSIKKGLLEAIDHANTRTTTEEVTLWLDVEVVEKFKAYGEDWQTRINDALRDAIQRGVVKR